MLLTQPNTRTVKLFQQHTLPLPSCCPVSGNPQVGSTITISYVPDTKFLEVYSLSTYISKFVGGYENVRDMEGMIQVIAHECATTIGVRVKVDAKIKLQREDSMRIIAKGIA